MSKARSAACVVGLTLLTVLASLVVAEGPGTPSLAQFDGDVAVCRRVVREYCAIVQGMAKAGATDTEQQARGLHLLGEARRQWISIQDRYGGSPPLEYASDKVFRSRLADIANAMDDMERSLAAGQARRSMLACGYGCGLFVTMHEENGLVYALDELFHLRKEIKTVQALMSVRGIDGVRGRLPAVLLRHDVALIAPPPFSADDDRAPAYQAAMTELSQALFNLVAAVHRADAAEAQKILAGLVDAVNKPYGLAL